MAVVGVVFALLSACGGSSGSAERKVLVDTTTDDFAMFAAANFPKKVEVVPGQTIRFEQQWGGEPHTITGGSSVSAILDKTSAWLRLFDGYIALAADNPKMVNPEDPGDATFAEFASGLKGAKPAAKRDDVLDAYRELAKKNPELLDIDNPADVPFGPVNSKIDELSENAFDGLRFASSDDGTISQNVGQPCYLKSGEPPEDENQSCANTQQRQPEFDGTYAFYNSGILRYDGPRGNTYRLKLADDIKPGTYSFYCAVHGPSQLSEIEVKKPGSHVPSAQAVARAGRDEANDIVLPLEKTFRSATKSNSVSVEGQRVKGPFAGLPSNFQASVNEFVPRTLNAKAGEPITWKLMGADHTVSFDVPPYLPIIQFGTKRVRFNPEVQEPAGGSPALGKPPQHGGVWKVDGGTYDGTGFWSSGLFGSQPYAEYTLRISKPGTYPYACLVHPKMIGKVVVT